ncbi:MAG: hypothetical protein EP343_08920 [Deltaproteobacteria bacterium]|nr:MAG: hypothetical protein EP343_08920 [Deltaproteobacteria bacterium]
MRQLLFFLLGLSLGVGVEPTDLHASQGGGVRLISTDKTVQISVYPGMKKTHILHNQAVLQAANFRAELYVLVFNEKKSRFSKALTLKRYDTLVRRNMMARLGRTAFQKQTQPMQIHGLPAIQGELSGGIGRVQVGYLLTSVESHDSFHQVLVWTLSSSFKQYRPLLENITNSFRRIDVSHPTSRKVAKVPSAKKKKQAHNIARPTKKNPTGQKQGALMTMEDDPKTEKDSERKRLFSAKLKRLKSQLKSQKKELKQLRAKLKKERQTNAKLRKLLKRLQQRKSSNTLGK